MRLFDRVVELSVGNTKITGLDVAFEIEKDLSPEPNSCHVEIFNLCPENRAILSKCKNVPIVLKAGYRDNLGIIFCGDLLRVSHIKEGPTWKTVIASGDGALAIQTKRIGKTYSAGTPVKTVVEDLAKQMGFSQGGSLHKLQDLTKILNRSYMVSGNPMAEIARLLSANNKMASIQNGTLQIFERDGFIQKEAISLGAENGLLSTPEMGTGGKISVRAVIMPEFIPGRRLFINSSLFKGFLTIHQVRFSGATFGQQWESEVGGKVI